MTSRRRLRPLLAVLAISCSPAPSAVPFDSSLPLTGAGLSRLEGRDLTVDLTVTDAPRLDSLRALLRRGRWEPVEPGSRDFSVDFQVRLTRDSTTAGLLAVGGTHLLALPATPNPVALQRRLEPGEREMLKRWFVVR